MARDPGGIITEVWAANGDRTPSAPIPTFTDGWDSRWSGADGFKPQREQFNLVLYRLFSLAKEINEHGGILEYNSGITYQRPALVFHNNMVWIANVDTVPAGSIPGEAGNTNWIVWIPGGAVTGLPSGDYVDGNILHQTPTGSEWAAIDRDIQLWDVLSLANASRSFI